MADKPIVLPPDTDVRAVSAQLGELDREGRVGRTAVQVGAPGAVVVILTWVARLAGLDLDPHAGVDMPADVVAAWIVVVTVGLSWAMNRRRHPPPPPPDD